VIIRDHAWRQKSPAVLVTFKGVILWNCLLLKLYRVVYRRMNEWMNEWMWSFGGEIVTGETWNTWRSTCLMTLYPPHIPHWLAWDWNWAFAVRDQWLTTWAMACPNTCHSWPVCGICSHK
jgi:hypothetical protein